MTIGKFMIEVSDLIDDLGLAISPMLMFIIVSMLMWVFHISMGLSSTWGPLMFLGGGILTTLTAGDWWFSGAKTWIVMVHTFTAGVWIASAVWLAVILN